jgi:hypothetical protein
MKSIRPLLVWAFALAVSTLPGLAEVKPLVEHNDNDHASSAFKFKSIPPPAKDDLATKAKFAIVDGEQDENGGDLDKLHDGKVPAEEDAPSDNFFFNAGTEGGRLLIDLGNVTEVKQINTYSWHPNTRGPQVYKLYASDGKEDGFNAQPKKAVSPEKCGWKLVASVDTRPKDGEGGGQYAVSISDSDGALGKYCYLLFDISRTEDGDTFGNTFYSEIDVIGQEAAGSAAGKTADAAPFTIQSPDGYCEIAIDTSGAPDLKDWAEQKLAPVLAAWYPKLTAMMASEGFTPPKRFSVFIRPGNGVAATGGTRVTANSNWLKRELNREAVGALLHEEVHVVQQYGGGRRNNPDGPRVRPPGWLVEGIPDYIRWFLYEPQSHGADAIYFKSRRNPPPLRYDGLYRITANFLNYVVEHYDKDKTFITKLNAVCRQGKYSDDIWKDQTGKTLIELNDEWKAALEKEMAALPAVAAATTSETASTQTTAAADSQINALTESEKAAGWKLLFNGKDFTGWHNFKREGVRPGWEVKDGALVCVDPHNAGDIVTADQYEWFELQLDYNISKAGNSGIMFHVTDQGGAAWATGPEFQLEDNVEAADRIRCGWLYALYQPPDDPKTGKPLDATKPVGEWNHVRLLVTPEKCVHEINGVKYFEYVLGSEDFNSRVAKSKFARMPSFAKSNTGYLCLQGDHGQVMFRNIKVLPIPAK